MQIALQSVSKSYDGGQTFAVRDVNLTIQQGEYLVCVGESGSGKTTMLKMINRLVELTEGTITIGNEDSREMDAVKLRRTIGYVIQGIGLFPHMTIGANVAVVPKLLGWSKEKINQRVREMLELVSLEPDTFMSRRPRELSGGQQQRVGVARALAGGPKTMLMDEPFGALDPITRDSLRDDFKNLQERLGLTVLMVTHDMAEALLLADRIAVMKEGEVVGLAPPRELISNPGHEYVSSMIQTPKRQADELEQMTTPA